MAFLVSVLILLSDPHTSTYSSSVVGFAAMSLASSTFIFEIIYYEWFRPRTLRYLAIPLSFIAFWVPALIYAHMRNQTNDAPSPFYELCFDAETTENVLTQFHYFISITQPVAIAMFLIWCYLLWDPQKFQRIEFLRRVSQGISVVLCLLGLAAILYTTTKYRGASQPSSINGETVWSFGQIIPLTAWVPVIIDILYVTASSGMSTQTRQRSFKTF